MIAAKKRTFGDPSQEVRETKRLIYIRSVSLHSSQVAHSYKLLGSVLLTRGKVEQARKYLTKVITCAKSIQPKMFYYLSLKSFPFSSSLSCSYADGRLEICTV